MPDEASSVQRTFAGRLAVTSTACRTTNATVDTACTDTVQQAVATGDLG